MYKEDPLKRAEKGKKTLEIRVNLTPYELLLKKKKKNLHFFKKCALVGSLAGTITGIAFFGSNIISPKQSEENITKEGKLLASEKKEYSKDFIEEGKEECPKAIETILKNNFTILYARLDGYCVISEEGLFRWVSLEGDVFTRMKDFMNDGELSAVSYDEIKDSLMLSPRSYGDYTIVPSIVQRENGEEAFKQPIYQEENLVGRAEYIRKDGQIMNVYVDSSETIYAGSLGEFSTLNDYIELVHYSEEAILYTKDTPSIEENVSAPSMEEIKIEENENYHFAEFYQSLFPFEEAQSHVYAAPTTKEQQNAVAANQLNIIDQVEKDGLLCLNQYCEVVYCALGGQIYSDYKSFLTNEGKVDINIKNFFETENLSLSRTIVLGYEVEDFHTDFGVFTKIIDTETGKEIGTLLSAEIEGVEYPLYENIESASYASSLPDLVLRKQIESYQKTGILPSIPLSPELEANLER